jgi:hypothetical protein
MEMRHGEQYMNRRILIKLIIYDAALALLAFGCSLLFESYKMRYMNIGPMYGGMALTVVFALLVCAFTWSSFQILKNCRRWQLGMVLNAAACMAFGVAVGNLLFYCTTLNMLAVFSMIKFMLWGGAVTIVLSFPLRLLKRKGLVA